MVVKKPLRVEFLAIGDELLDGRVSDSNSVRLARALSDFGIVLARRVTLPDTVGLIR